MIVVGLTGSLAMGKSTTALMLRQLGYPVHDSDAAVHRLLDKGGAAVPVVAAAFPGTMRSDGGIDRALLGRKVFGDPAALRRLEAIIHPLAGRARDAFLRRCRTRREPLAVLDVPLLFETGGERKCDAVLVATAPAFLQRQRALRRPRMDAGRLAAILAQQMPDSIKRRRTPFVIETGIGRRHAFRRLIAHLAAISGTARLDRGRGRRRYSARMPVG